MRHLLLVALVLRLVALAVPCVVHPDEIYQYLEPAHRWLFGYGIQTWEWRYGIRSWLIPLLIAGPMKLGAMIAPGTGLYLLLPRLLMVLASLSTVMVAWRLGERLSRLHALFAGAVAAFWYEMIFYAPHILSETLAVAAILPAALLLVDRARETPARLVLAGALLGIALSLRFQYGPAVATLLVATCGRRPRSWPLLLAGGLLGLIPAALADAAMGAVPYRWLIENVRLNLVADRAAAYGVSGPFGLLGEIWPRWSLWSVPLLALAALGARRYPALAWTAAINFAFHSAIAHKEYRFILLSAVLVVILAAIGSVDWIRRIARRDGAAKARERLRFAALCWCVASASLAFGGFRPVWHGLGDEYAAYQTLRADPGLCGVGVYLDDFSITPGYSVLHRDVPILWYTSDALGSPRAELAGSQAAVNVVLARRDDADELPSAYHLSGCSGDICRFRRPGGCAPVGADLEMNRVLARLDD